MIGRARHPQPVKLFDLSDEEVHKMLDRQQKDRVTPGSPGDYRRSRRIAQLVDEIGERGIA